MNDQKRNLDRVKQNFWGNESGAVAAYVGIGMVVFLGFAALALDIAHMVSVKRELVKAAEAGALSGARGLWPIDISTATGRDPDWSNAETKASATAKKNQADGATLTAGEVTVEVGRWDYVAKTFTPGNNSSANGVRVTTRRNRVPTILAQVLGQGPRDMNAAAIAVMDFATAVGKGTLPIAVNQDYAETPGRTIYIGFNPDPEDNGGWFAKAPDSASAKTFKDYIDNASCPPLNIGDIIDLENGVDASALEHLDNALDAMNTALGEHSNGWIVFLPVVDTPKFNHEDRIDSFVPIRILDVQKTGNPKYVKGEVLTMAEAASALPGGGKFGALAPPKLVQ
jgi:Flp pilus assembly protein TadG